MGCNTYGDQIRLLLLIVLIVKKCSGEIVPCVFIFGDSLSDNGNNNEIRTAAKANYLPYGVDFPSGPTGRFTNGRTTVDFITQFLGFEKFIPPFANTSGSDIVQGVNYASGSGGIRKETGRNWGATINLGSQIANHRVIISQIASKLESSDKTEEHLNKCLNYVNIGSNDYIFNYFLPNLYPTSSIYNPQDYAEALIQEFSHHLRALHDLGSRKFALFGLHLLGCVPQVLINHGDEIGSQCVEEYNKAVLIFNDKLRVLVHQLNQEFSDSKFIYVNSALISFDNPIIWGIMKIVKGGCCEVRGNGICVANKAPCKERNLHVFWDLIHPTEAINRVLATLAYKSLIPNYTYPLDISDLAHL